MFQKLNEDYFMVQKYTIQACFETEKSPLTSGIYPQISIKKAALNEDGLRKGRDSNPRYRCRYTRFPGVPIKPLLHLSNASSNKSNDKGKEFSSYFDVSSAVFFCSL